MNEITVEAKAENQGAVIDFINLELAKLNCPDNIRRQIDTAASEIFANISDYAYGPKSGDVTVIVEIVTEPSSVTLTFTDSGAPFDPLKKEDPDISAPFEERDIGGLGIFIVKKSMDEIFYERKDGRNILKIRKNI